MSLKIFHWRSLSTRVTLFMLAIFLFGIWALALYASHTLRTDMQRMLGAHQYSTISYIASDINVQLQSRFNTLHTLALGITPTMMRDKASLQALLEQLRAVQAPFNGGMIVYQPDGLAIAEAPRSTGRVGNNYADRDYIIDPLQHGKQIIGKPHISKTKRFPEFIMAVPIRDAEGKVIGALSGVTNLSEANFLDSISSNSYGKSGGYVLISPKDQLIVTATDKRHSIGTLNQADDYPPLHQFSAGHEGTSIANSSHGIELLVSAKNIPVSGWLIVSSLPTEEAFAPIFIMQQRLMVAAIVLTLLAGGLTWRVLRWQLLPMQNTAKMLATLSENNLPLHPLPITRDDEIGQLIGNFNRLLATLHQRKEALTESEYRLKFAIEGAGDGLWDWNLARNTAFYSGRWKEMLGFSEAEMSNTIDAQRALIHPSDKEKTLAALQAHLDGKTPIYKDEHRMQRKDGKYNWVLDRGVVVSRDNNGKPQRIIGIQADITERKRAEEKLQLAASVFTHALEGIMIADLDGKIIDINDAFVHITGYNRDEVIGQNPRMLYSGHHEDAFYTALWRDLIEYGQWHGEIRYRHQNGEMYVALQTINAVYNAQDEIDFYVALFSNISAIKKHEQQLQYRAHYDALTKLPNRVLLADRLHQAMTQTQRRGQHLAVAFLDLDGFKAVNDQHGHEAGDQLLMSLAERMKLALREGDSLARLGGDEFIAVLLDVADEAAATPVLNRLLAAAAEPVQFGLLPLSVSASIGVTFYPQSIEVDTDHLLNQADQAMYQAKLAGKNCFHIFREPPIT